MPFVDLETNQAPVYSLWLPGMWLNRRRFIHFAGMRYKATEQQAEDAWEACLAGVPAKEERYTLRGEIELKVFFR